MVQQDRDLRQRVVPGARLGAVAILCAVAAACSAPTNEAGRGAFSEIRFGAPAPATAPRLRPPLPLPVGPSPVLPVSIGAAERRIDGYLSTLGFVVEGHADGEGRRIAATRMGSPAGLDGEAACVLQAMRRPDIASTEVDVRLRPASGGVQFFAHARFVEIDTRLISGELSRQVCRSRGVLEAALAAAVRDGDGDGG